MFKLASAYSPAGDQGQAIDAIVKGIQKGHRYQTLKGVTGSGKTFSMAKIVEQIQKPTLVLSHNKTLAAQLYREFKGFFPENAVEYFVSYYDYYQPEAYMAKRDLYIEKDSSINKEIERFRNSATANLMERSDVLVVATVSCIYGLGNPMAYRDMCIKLAVGQPLNLEELKEKLVRMQYTRNQDVLDNSSFRVCGDVVEVFPSYRNHAYSIVAEWDTISKIRLIDPLNRTVIEECDSLTIYPAKQFVIPEENIQDAIRDIEQELKGRIVEFQSEHKVVEAQRIRSRTEYDLEMMREIGYCKGVENYSRHLGRRKEGERPTVLLDYFPDDYITFVDESHVALPQLRGMYAGDRARKENLVEYGFRLPSALDNRPLMIHEFEKMSRCTVCVSATPNELELERSSQVVEQVIRPTGLVDPEIVVRPTGGQIDNLIAEIRKRIASNERTLITTLTKKLSEQLADYLSDLGIATQYIHSELETIERLEVLTALREGKIDVLVGINLLREGLDLPEVSLIAIMDADKIGFLRSESALIQIVGRAARNVNGKVIMYADKMSSAMEAAIRETSRRRDIQIAHNKKYGITPRTIQKSIETIISRQHEKEGYEGEPNMEIIKSKYNITATKQRRKLIGELEGLMTQYANSWEFERAAQVRDEIAELQR